MWNIIYQSGPIGFALLILALFSTAVILYKTYYFHTYKIQKDILEIGEKLKPIKHIPEAETLFQTYWLEKRIEHQKYLTTLSNIVSLSPLLGLLGTLLGMIEATRGIVEINNTELLKGISQALFTTVEGIVIAIPSLIFYNFFIKKINELEESVKTKIFQNYVLNK